LGWIILTLLLGLVFVASILTLVGSRSAAKKTGHSSDTPFYAGIAAAIAALAWVALTIFMSAHAIGQREVGVVHNFSGTISGKVDPGIAWTWPFQSVSKTNVGILREAFSLGSDNAAVSKDQQPIFADLTLNYQVEPKNIVTLYKTVGPQWKQTLLDSRVLQDFKEVTAGFTAAQITTSRPELRKQTRDRLRAELQKYDIAVIDFFIPNLSYSETYRAAIDRKNVQVQEALQAEAKVAQATAEANQAIATAKGQAESKLVNARADAEANRLKERTLTPLLVQQNAIDKLSDNVKIICTGQCPFLPASLLGQ
jgi:regulator of protease activity HflC (stomatin/prohibitin superfamily)